MGEATPALALPTNLVSCSCDRWTGRLDALAPDHLGLRYCPKCTQALWTPGDGMTRAATVLPPGDA